MTPRPEDPTKSPTADDPARLNEARGYKVENQQIVGAGQSKSTDTCL
jgi:hypothetical protein